MKHLFVCYNATWPSNMKTLDCHTSVCRKGKPEQIQVGVLRWGMPATYNNTEIWKQNPIENLLNGGQTLTIPGRGPLRSGLGCWVLLLCSCVVGCVWDGWCTGGWEIILTCPVEPSCQRISENKIQNKFTEDKKLHLSCFYPPTLGDIIQRVDPSL